MEIESNDFASRRRRRLVTPGQVKQLMAEFDGRCLFSNCNAPARLPDGTRLLEFVHINSVFPGGVRYDPSLSEHDLNTAANLILVCPNHHQIIDHQPDIYSAQELARLRADRLSAGASPPPTVERRASITRLERGLEIWKSERENALETFWQSVFEDRSQLLCLTTEGRPFVLNAQCYVGGKALDNRGGRVADFLARHDGDVTLIEIKVPTTKLLGRAYRAGVYPPSVDLAGAVAQALCYRYSLLSEVHSLSRREAQQVAYHVRTVVIVGDAEREKFSEDERRSFELYRRSLKDVSVLTFDELFLSLENLKVLMEVED